MKWLALILFAISPAGAEDKDVDYILKLFRREGIADPIQSHILRLTPKDAPVRATYLVPVKSTKQKPPVLELYWYRSGDRPKLLADPRGPDAATLTFGALKSLAVQDDDQDGLDDIQLTAVFTAEGRQSERTAVYRNLGTNGYKLVSAPPPPAGLKNGFPLSLDCKFTGLDGGWWVAACPENHTLQVKLKLDGDIRLQFETPGATAVTVEGQDARAVALAYDGPQCRVVKVIRLKDGGLVSDTDCTASTFCALTQFPKEKQCKGAVECGGASGGFRWKKEFDLCK